MEWEGVQILPCISLAILKMHCWYVVMSLQTRDRRAGLTRRRHAVLVGWPDILRGNMRRCETVYHYLPAAHHRVQDAFVDSLLRDDAERDRGPDLLLLHHLRMFPSQLLLGQVYSGRKVSRHESAPGNRVLVQRHCRVH